MPQQTDIHEETLFNAGVDTALQISRLAKQAEYFASLGDYPKQYLKFESMEMWMSPKFRNKADVQTSHRLLVAYHIQTCLARTSSTSHTL